MAALHLLASAGFLALAVALGGFRNWARRMHILIAMFALLILGAYAAVYVAIGLRPGSDWPRWPSRRSSRRR